jgi:hypothetical protein
MRNHSKINYKIFKDRVNDLGACPRWQGWSWALLDLGPGLALQRRSARLRQLLRLLIPAQAYGYRREDLHEFAMQDLNDGFQFD